MKDCCKITDKMIDNGLKKCVRKSDKKVFDLPRRFSKRRCTRRKIRGFTMRSSCAPYKDCNKRGVKKGGYSKRRIRRKAKIHKIAYFSGGCFWGIQEKVDKLNGVLRSEVGYMGGKTHNPTYNDVLKGNTNHAETVKIIYNPHKITYKELLEYIFSIHDPTSLNKQGNDVGTQYRSIVFYSNEEEKQIYEDFLNNLHNKNRIVTELLSAENNRFYRAEEYHQKYNKKQYGGKDKRDFLYNPNNPKKSFDVYIDKNPNDTIPIKYKTYDDVLKTVRKLERLYKSKKYTHKRIWQVGMIMKVRLEAMKKHKNTLYPNAKNVNKRFKLAEKYFKFLGERTKVKPDSERYKMVFKY